MLLRLSDCKPGVLPLLLDDPLCLPCERMLWPRISGMSAVVLQAYAMMMAGYESTANALAFTLYLLTLNKDKEARLIAEVDAFGAKQTPCYADLARRADSFAPSLSEQGAWHVACQPDSLQATRLAPRQAAMMEGSENRHHLPVVWCAASRTSRPR